MTTYLFIGILSGLLFAIMDGWKNANPLAVQLLEVYKPIARDSINFVAGIILDLTFGFLLAGLFLLLAPSLPGGSGWVKGISFAVMVWLLREFMQAASQWMMFKIPYRTLIYNLITGFIEMAMLGLLYGLTLS